MLAGSVIHRLEKRNGIQGDDLYQACAGYPYRPLSATLITTATNHASKVTWTPRYSRKYPVVNVNPGW